MAVDFAALGFKVESSQAQIASRRLHELGNAANEAESAAARLQKQADKVGRSMQKMGRSFSLYVTAPILAAGAASLKFGIEFDSTLAKINTLVGVSRDHLAQFRKQVLDLAPSVGRGPAELANALFAITSAGQRGAQALDTLEKAAKASAIGLGDTRTIALAATAATQAYGAANVDSTHALEVLIGTIEQGNLEAESLAPVLGRVIGIAAELGVTFEDLGGFIATFTRLGVNADEAATALRSTLATLQKPSEEAVEAFKKMNTSIEEVRARIKQGGIGEFTRVFQDLVNRSREFNVDLVSIVPNVRALSGVLGVFGGEGTVALEVVEGVAAAVGTMEDRFQAVIDLDPAHQINVMRAELERMMILLSDELVPIFLQAVNAIKGAAEAFNELEPATQKTIVATAGLLALIGPFLLIAGSLTRVIGAVGLALAKAGGIGAAGALSLALRGLITLLSGPVGFAVAMASVIKLVGDAYVGALEDAIIETKEFKAALDGLAFDDLQTNLISVAGEVDRMIAEREAALMRIATLQERLANVGSPRMGQGISNELQEELAALRESDPILQSLIRLRDSYTERVREGALAAAEAAAAADQLNDSESGGLVDLTEDEIEALAKLRDELDPAAKEMRELEKARKLLDKAFKAGDLKPQEWERLNRLLDESTEAFKRWKAAQERLNEIDFMTQAELDANFAYLDSLGQIDEQVQALADSLDPTGAQLREFGKAYELLNEAFEKGVINDEQFITISEALDDAVFSVELMNDSFQKMGARALDTLSEMQGLFHQDSQAAEVLRTAMIALNIVMGVHAVLKQLAEGDVYSAIPRALAVGALVASLGVQTGASGGGATSRTLRETQGTGSVLGDAEAKTESIVRASEITARATSELVGINRGMLHALQNLQSGISGATVQLARGASGTDFSGALPSGDLPSWALGLLLPGGPIGLLVDNLLGGFVSGLLNKLFGGKSKILDQGIRIAGGAIGDLMNDVFVQAFVRFKAKKNIFDDYDEYIQFENLPDEVGTQFALVFGAIRDTVLEAALALGLDRELIEERLAAFRLDDIDISFTDLSGDEIREELEAIFGQIFDDLATSVIPWIEQFQQVGEGLGETLVRVATSVQVFQEAIGALGFMFDETDPEMFAQAAVGLVELTGGVDEFISKFSTFFDKFASDEQKLAFVTDQLSRAFEQAGLTLPETRDGMIDLMHSFDATTDEGRRHIAMLLDIADTADQYYSLVERAEEERLKQAREAAEMMQNYRDTLAAFISVDYGPLVQLKTAFRDAMDAADALNASQREYAMITRSFNLQLQRMAAELTVSVLSLTKQLFGTGLDDLGGSVDDGLEEVRLVSNRLFTDWQNALERIREYTESLLLDENLTTLTPAEQFAESQRQFNQILAAARAGDVEAAAELPDAAQALLEEARFMFASGQQYQKIFDATLAALDSVQMPSGIPEFIEETINGGGRGEPDLRTEQERMWDDMIESLERFLLATDLATSLRDLSMVLDTSVIKLAEQLGVPLRELVAILGVELGALNEGTAAALANVAELLGADIYELVDALDIGLRELATASGVHLDEMSKALVGELRSFADMLGVDVLGLAKQLDLTIAELAKTFGIGIDNFKASQFSALVEFSNALGAGIDEVARELKINLGSIKDATSLLSESLDLAIRELPDAIQADLGPLLTAIRDATTASDASGAIGNLGDYILGLPDDLSASLLPFLELIGFKPGTPEVTALNSINRNTADTVAAVDRVNRTLKGTGGKNYLPKNSLDFSDITDPVVKDAIRRGKIPIVKGSFQTGGEVPETGLYRLHAREFVVNPARTNVTVSAPDNELTREELSQIRSVLQDIREQNREYQRADLEVARGIESGVKQQAEQQRRRAHG